MRLLSPASVAEVSSAVRRASAFTVPRHFVVTIAAAVLLTTAGCSQSEKPLLESGLGARAGGAAGDRFGRGGDGRIGRGDLGSRAGEDGQGGARNGAGGNIVYFASDSSDLTPEGQASLEAEIPRLRRGTQRTITIEGHADERGTREYNIALGAKRANAVKAFLVARGVPASSLKAFSYGKERPVATCDDISCWSQNRRAQLVVGG